MRTMLTLGAVLLFGCQASPEPKRDPPVAASSEPVKAGEVLFSLQRTPCFGRCPTYRVEVRADGTVRFQGERHVRVTEPVETKLEAADLAKLVARLEQSGFAGWSDFTNTQVSDMATVVLTFRGKTLRHYLGDEKAPDALTELERDVEAIIGTARWVTGAGADTK